MTSTFKKCWQRTDVVGAENDVDPWGLLDDGFAILLRQAATDSNLEVWVISFATSELSEVAV